MHACHAAVIVHLLEGWDFHEVSQPCRSQGYSVLASMFPLRFCNLKD